MDKVARRRSDTRPSFADENCLLSQKPKIKAKSNMVVLMINNEMDVFSSLLICSPIRKRWTASRTLFAYWHMADDFNWPFYYCQCSCSSCQTDEEEELISRRNSRCCWGQCKCTDDPIENTDNSSVTPLSYFRYHGKTRSSQWWSGRTTTPHNVLNLWSPIYDPSVCGSWGLEWAHSVARPCIPISFPLRYMVYL